MGDVCLPCTGQDGLPAGVSSLAGNPVVQHHRTNSAQQYPTAGFLIPLPDGAIWAITGIFMFFLISGPLL